jgi:hypothetical protein
MRAERKIMKVDGLVRERLEIASYMFRETMLESLTRIVDEWWMNHKKEINTMKKLREQLTGEKEIYEE